MRTIEKLRGLPAPPSQVRPWAARRHSGVREGCPALLLEPENQTLRCGSEGTARLSHAGRRLPCGPARPDQPGSWDFVAPTQGGTGVERPPSLRPAQTEVTSSALPGAPGAHQCGDISPCVACHPPRTLVTHGPRGTAASSVRPGLGPPSQLQKRGDGQTRHAGSSWSCLGQGRRGTKASLVSTIRASVSP